MPLDVQFKPLLMVERTLADEMLKLRQRQMLGIDVEGEVRSREEELIKIRREIVKKAHEKIHGFAEIAGKLGLNNDDINALSALVGLLIYLRWPYEVSSFHGAKRILWLCKPTQEDKRKFEERNGERHAKRYNGHVRRYLGLLTAALLNKEKKQKGTFPPKTRNQKEVLRKLLGILMAYSEAISGEGAG